MGGFYATIPVTMPKAKPKTTIRKPARKKSAPATDRLTRVEKLVAANSKAIAELRQANAEANAEAAKRNAEIAKQLATLGATVKATEKTNAENAKAIAELRQAIAQTDAKADKRAAEADKRAAEADKRAAELDKRADKALRVAEKNNEYFGNHVRNEGELLEMECYNALMKTKTVNGVKLDGFQPGPKDPHHGVEIDLIGFNGKVTMPIEVKRTMSPADVRRFAEVRMERFPKAFPYLARDKEVIPVIIFALPRTGVDADGKPEDPVQLALDLGLTVLQSTGENQLSPITSPDQVISRPHETTDLT